MAMGVCRHPWAGRRLWAGTGYGGLLCMSPTPLPKRDANEIQIEELKALSFLSLTIDNNSKSEAYFNLFTNKTLFFTSMKI